MAHDEGLAELLRGELADLPVTERRMFGGLCFLLGGHMVCGVMRDNAMIRVGAAGEPAALAIPGTAPMIHGGKRMGGFIRVGPEVLGDDGPRARLLALALDCVRSLPPKRG